MLEIKMHEGDFQPGEVLEDFKALESAIEMFDARYADYDFSALPFDQIWKLEDRLSHYPAYKVKEAVYKARVAMAEARNRERERQKQLLQERYGYYCPGEDVTNGLTLYGIKCYERAMVQTAYRFMAGKSDKEIRERIKESIPTITDKEIDEYRREK